MSVFRGMMLVVLLPAVTWAMSFEDARHLLNRTGFGATPEEIAEFAKLDRAAAVNRIVASA